MPFKPGVYPLPAFHFEVSWGGTSTAFTEVSGLTVEHQVIEYRHGLSKEHTSKMPGLPKFGSITLKRGIFKGDNEISDWMVKKNLNTTERRDLIITLLDENGVPARAWTAERAFVTKLEGAALKASDNGVAIESVEIAHEGITVTLGI
jgi:phage tail-like protein